jgi:phage protein D
MSKRAVFMVTVAGTNITAPLLPVLISLTVSDRVGTHADTATLDIDDTDGRIVLPQLGAPVIVALGWEGGGVRVVFTGTVDEVRSSGSRGAGTDVVDLRQGRRHDREAEGSPAAPLRRQDGRGHPEGSRKHRRHVPMSRSIRALASITRTYFEMRDESFIHMGERLAREIGGNFRVQGTRAVMSKRGAVYPASVATIFGQNLHAWDIAPALGRAQYGKVRARWYDPADAVWKETEEATSLGAEARYDHRYGRASEGEARQQASADGRPASAMPARVPSPSKVIPPPSRTDSAS